MTKNEIIEKQKKVRNYLSQNRLKEAFDELKYMSESAMAWEITDEISRLEESYRLMLNYTMQGVDDPSRMELYDGIVNILRLLLNRIVRQLLSNEEPTLYYNTLRFERLRPNDSISNLIKSIYVRNGEVAQLARAFGSYPKGRGFDPLLRYQFEL